MLFTWALLLKLFGGGARMNTFSFIDAYGCTHLHSHPSGSQFAMLGFCQIGYLEFNFALSEKISENAAYIGMM